MVRASLTYSVSYSSTMFCNICQRATASDAMTKEKKDPSFQPIQLFSFWGAR